MDAEKSKKRRKPRWYEHYLPFIARSPEKRLEWLRSISRRRVLSLDEITPYVRLFLDVADGEVEHLRDLLLTVEGPFIDEMLRAAEIEDIPRFFSLIPNPTLEQAVIALAKTPPPYEESPNLLLDKVFEAVHNRSEHLFEEAAVKLLRRQDVPPHFPEAYERFQEIIADRRILSSLYPMAR